MENPMLIIEKGTFSEWCKTHDIPIDQKLWAEALLVGGLNAPLMKLAGISPNDSSGIQVTELLSFSGEGVSRMLTAVADARGKLQQEQEDGFTVLRAESGKITIELPFIRLSYEEEPTNDGNNSDKHYLTIEADQAMTVNGLETNSVTLTIVGPLEMQDLFLAMAEMSKIRYK